jgi:hypothetical protein
MYLDNVQIKACDWSQASWRYSWTVIANSKANQPVPMQPSRRAFEGFRTPVSVQQFYVEYVRTTEQHHPDARSISIQQGVGFQKSTLLGNLYKPSGRRRSISIQQGVGFQKSTLVGSLYKPFGRRGNTSRQCPVFQNIPEFHSNSEKILAKTVRTLGWRKWNTSKWYQPYLIIKGFDKSMYKTCPS